MAYISAWTDAKSVRITGHGFDFEEPFELADGVVLTPDVHALNSSGLDRCATIKERAGIETMHEIATFSIEVPDEAGGTSLANKGFNSLWDFHLLSLAGKPPVSFSTVLRSESGGSLTRSRTGI